MLKFVLLLIFSELGVKSVKSDIKMFYNIIYIKKLADKQQEGKIKCFTNKIFTSI